MLQDPFGNYVVQYVLDLGQGDATGRIMKQLEGHYPELSQQKFSSNVVEKCLKLSGPLLADARERVIREILTSNMLPRLLQVSHLKLHLLSSRCLEQVHTDGLFIYHLAKALQTPG